ncbi:hypothetical protein ATE84_2282 [Aquimarina sp. MAR_2010_214]|nr:hypothetical protein [Aquimarina sp. MAR_2010_214]PKV50229.1 hypothetical protein ATE84_2282 [Aquimarina sp. MAR_2010_214]
MKNRNNIQRPGLRKKFFGSKAYLRGIRKKVKINMKPKKAITI